MRKCRKCKVNYVSESRKWCEECKIAPRTCECGCIFKSKKHNYCRSCRNSKGKNGDCVVCKHRRFIYARGCCTTCYRFLSKYSISVDELLKLRSITICQICGIEVNHHTGNGNGRAVIDHDHSTGKVRGVLCNQCNIIEGMIRDFDHLENFYKKYKNWININR